MGRSDSFMWKINRKVKYLLGFCYSSVLLQRQRGNHVLHSNLAGRKEERKKGRKKKYLRERERERGVTTRLATLVLERERRRNWNREARPKTRDDYKEAEGPYPPK